MTFLDILSVQGLSKEQCSAIMKEMERNRIFFTKEEKIEERYHKLRQKRDEIKSKLDQAVCNIADLKSKLKENEKLLISMEARDKGIADLKKEYDFKIADMIITVAIQKELSEMKYPELLIDKFDKTKLSINSNGIVKGIDEQLAAFKDTYKELFKLQETCKEDCPAILQDTRLVMKALILDNIINQDEGNSEMELQEYTERRNMQHDK
jgi:septal ring factor EnvC (AmiA/AmiB activator)